MYIDTGYNFDSSKIIKLLSEMSKTFQSKIYVSMDDIEKLHLVLVILVFGA